MGLFDTVKAKAGELAADAERAGKVAAAQARGVALQGDVRKAERELGQAAYALIERGDQLHPDLGAAARALSQAREALAGNEREIAGLRGEAPVAGDTHESSTSFVTVTVPPAVPATDAAGTAGGEAGPAGGEAGPAETPPEPAAAPDTPA